MANRMFPFGVNFGIFSKVYILLQADHGFVLAISTKSLLSPNLLGEDLVPIGKSQPSDMHSNFVNSMIWDSKEIFSRGIGLPFILILKEPDSIGVFVSSFPFCRVDNIESFSSDHAYLLIHLNHLPPPDFNPIKKSKPFRFEAMWVRSKDCEKIIRANWNTDFDIISNKLDQCKIGLLNWSKTTFGCLDKQIAEIKSAISKLQKGIITSDVKQKLIEYNAQLDSLLLLHDLKWKQRAKQHWYKEGDKNSRFFHAFATARKEINTISTLRDNCDILQSATSKIENIIGNFFADIFSSSSPSQEDITHALSRVRTKVTAEMANSLTEPFTADEVSRALKHMHPFKSPGPDDNVLVAYEIHHSMKSRRHGNTGHMSIKVDMSKAFDRVEWSFLIQVLAAFGFPSQFISLITTCISTSSFSFLLNGQQFGSLNPTRGIRQGDPLSPYLFILCSKVFSLILQDLQATGAIHGIAVNRNAPTISHLFFADDTLLFGHATVHEATTLQFAIGLYERASGQRINREKSGILFSPATPMGIQNRICSILNIPEVGGHGKYLGLASVIGANKQQIFSDIVDRIWGKIHGWKEKYLSQAGRLTLIQAVIQSIPTYAMSCFKLPDNVIAKIQSMTARFLWSGDPGKNSLHWRRWDEICKNKKEGGLGLRNLKAFNMALLCKQAWRLLSCPSSLLARVFRAKYYPHSSLLDASLGNRPS
ncbi:hypothetical protein DH2020_002963 [Rehmannia glutinosa]|uniref:Reverse transcriptase domain-containing protein n=1 Tax=Rehmannia glutinosa TaxID=99300 RepID=A0ABR0XV76_REHGL